MYIQVTVDEGTREMPKVIIQLVDGSRVECRDYAGGEKTWLRVYGPAQVFGGDGLFMFDVEADDRFTVPATSVVYVRERP